jgi:Flp pilus assembly pilin Flp
MELPERHQGSVVRSFLREDEGQDVIEYIMLLVFLGLGSAALFIGAGGSADSIWTVNNAQVASVPSGGH